MAEVYLVEGRGDLLCNNCGETTSHKVALYYDDAANKLLVRKTCTCEVQDDGDPYEEERTVEVTSE
jgi:hypothetical protein